MAGGNQEAETWRLVAQAQQGPHSLAVLGLETEPVTMTAGSWAALPAGSAGGAARSSPWGSYQWETKRQGQSLPARPGRLTGSWAQKAPFSCLKLRNAS